MKTRIIFGLCNGTAWFIANLVNSILLFKGELVNMTGIVVILKWLISIAGIWLGIRSIRESTDKKSISYRKGLGAGFMISTFWGVSSTGLALLYTTFFMNFNLVDKIIELELQYKTMAGIMPMNSSLNNGIIAATYFAHLYLHPLYMSSVDTVVNIVIGTVISLILAAFVKRRIFGRHLTNTNLLILSITAILIALSATSCSLLRPKPKGLLTEAAGSPFSVGSSPNSIAVGDFNGDSKADLAILNAGSNNLTVLLSDGNGGFKETTDSPYRITLPSSVVTGDFNKDGKLDLAVLDAFHNNITLFLGNGTGGFRETEGSPIRLGGSNFKAPEWTAGLAGGDFNGDGNLDLAIAVSRKNIVRIMLGNGRGEFSEAPESPISAGTDPWALVVGDFNGDSKADLAILNAGSNNVTVLLGNGMGGFAEVQGSPFGTGSNPQSVAVGDFNCDGKLDLAIANNQSSNITVLLGNGSGKFNEAPGSPFSLESEPTLILIKLKLGPTCLAVGDFNCDGKPDLVITTNGDRVTVRLGDGTGVFTEDHDSPFAVGSFPSSVIVSDFNNDGKPDLAITNKWSGNISILLNNYFDEGKKGIR